MLNETALADNVKIYGKQLSAVQEVKYLDKIIANDGDVWPEIINQ